MTATVNARDLPYHTPAEPVPKLAGKDVHLSTIDLHLTHVLLRVLKPISRRVVWCSVDEIDLARGREPSHQDSAGDEANSCFRGHGSPLHLACLLLYQCRARINHS